MTDALLDRTVTSPAVANRSKTALLIAVPFYRGEELVERIVASLIECSDEIEALGASVVLYNDSPDYQPLCEALDNARAEISGAFGVSVRTNAANLGWVKTANLAMREAVQLGADLLLLNSDTVVFPGALTEMTKALSTDRMIGFVNPRSNNATLASLPIGDRFVKMGPSDGLAAYKEVARTLPDLTYVPTAVGFALLIRRSILVTFGFFDEAYGVGYNEENDLVMRASRCGYRAVLANRAFVWHEGEKSLGKGNFSKQMVEEANRAILLSRYPEYARLVDYWFQGVEHRTEVLLSALLPGPDGRRKIAFDFSSFGRFHSGTQKAGVQLLKAALQCSDAYEIDVLCTPEVYEFHGLDQIGVKRSDPHGPETFAAIFRVGQPFEWDPVRRLTLKGAVTGIFMLDTIALDCSHLYSPFQFDMWQYAIQYCDFIVYNSEFTAQQFQRRFTHTNHPHHIVSLHSLDLDDYRPTSRLPPSDAIPPLGRGFILVMGNQYPHKGVAEAANSIASARPDLTVVALGLTKERSSLHGASPGAPPPTGPAYWLADLPNLHGFEVGVLPDADVETLQRNARLIIVPSHYEGFGLTIPGALALGTPIAVRPLPPHVEIHGKLGRNPNVHFFETTADLLRLVSHPPEWRDAPQLNKGDGKRAADDILRLMESAILAASYTTISQRFRVLHTIYGAAHILNLKPPPSPPDAAAQLVGDTTTRIFRRLFRFPPIYWTTRVFFRGVRLLFRGGRPTPAQ